ncbi:hypothetical protein Tco_0463055 [Tanacetum coccineum]
MKNGTLIRAKLEANAEYQEHAFGSELQGEDFAKKNGGPYMDWMEPDDKLEKGFSEMLEEIMFEETLSKILYGVRYNNKRL